MSKDYFQTARENEGVFRNILRDLRNNREKRPAGAYVPKDLETEAALDIIFTKYSTGNRTGIFTITDFTRPDKNKATISFQDLAPFSGRAAELEYKVNEDNSVEYTKPGIVLVS